MENSSSDGEEGRSIAIVATNIDSKEIVKQVTDRIAESYPDMDREHISSLASEELDKISSARVTDYFTVLTERAVRSRLKD
ncbi:hypothetical protein CQ034_05980 [Microbacterium sp. MYb45]|nr:hypothetical protein CQ034_05980 [Microbacterium sp. MYb45]